ncbi:hypothetical protein OH76DRAFT_220795 [Lentinus brumalis]|uniref:Uncharacterized protein n=1 Tax=Lentinus brumalis TaxID=2498619 RepID=A0A371CM42_9APHY|nr:hypothetical protein OH76DRAFT_220795 [Polyporus brumalis]
MTRRLIDAGASFFSRSLCFVWAAMEYIGSEPVLQYPQQRLLPHTTSQFPLITHSFPIMMHSKIAAFAAFLLVACSAVQAQDAGGADLFGKRQVPPATVTVTTTEPGPTVVTTSTTTLTRPTSTSHVTSTITTATTTTFTETVTDTTTRTSTVTTTTGGVTVTGNRRRDVSMPTVA